MERRSLNGSAQDEGEPNLVRSLASRLVGRRMECFIFRGIRKIPQNSAKFRKATIGFVMSVRLSAWQNWSAIGRIFIIIIIIIMFIKG